MILLMSVNPGFGGQSFIPSALDKLKQARKIIDASGRDIRLEIDGGVKVDNIAEIKAAGADTFVSGSGIFGKGQDSDPNRYDSIIGQMREALAQGLQRLDRRAGRTAARGPHRGRRRGPSHRRTGGHGQEQPPGASEPPGHPDRAAAEVAVPTSRTVGALAGVRRKELARHHHRTAGTDRRIAR
jgi:hypothetical protein